MLPAATSTTNPLAPCCPPSYLCPPLFPAPSSSSSFLPHRPPLPTTPKTYHRTRSSSSSLITCSLTVLRQPTLRRLLPTLFTGDQWKYYWGITESDKFGKVYEAASATFFGLWTSWFLTFLIGIPAATILGTVFLFYWILAPGLAAYRRNLSFRGAYFARHPRDDGVFGALFSGKVVRIGRITQSKEYNRPEALVMCVEDEQGRKLRVYAPVLPSYKQIRPGMRAEGLVLSESPGFEELIGVSDIFVPACGAFVGDYPYLDKVRFRDFLAARFRREKGRKREHLQRIKGQLLGAGGEEEEEMRMDEFVEEEEEEEGGREFLPLEEEEGVRGKNEDLYASLWESNGRYDDDDDDDDGLLRIDLEEERRQRRARRRRMM